MSIDQKSDYDSGYLNDYGGGNVGWWKDYIRAEVGRCNDHWRMLIEREQPVKSPWISVKDQKPPKDGKLFFVRHKSRAGTIGPEYSAYFRYAWDGKKWCDVRYPCFKLLSTDEWMEIPK